MIDDDYPGGWFGDSWGAPVCDDARHLPTPVGEECLLCQRLITADDQGMTVPHAGHEPGPLLRSMHLACFLGNIGVDEAPSITCPRCGRTSYHPVDVSEGYCGACHDWTSAKPLR